MTRGMKTVWGLVLAAVAAVNVGCGGGGPPRYDVVTALDPALTSGTTPTIAVNIVGEGGTDAGRWSNVSMSKYWTPDSPERKAAAGRVKEFVFGPGKTEPMTLSKSDPIWNVWGRPTQLVVMANLPGAHDDRPGADDDRRLVIPLDPARWDADQKIMITVQRGRIRLDTPPKPPKK